MKYYILYTILFFCFVGIQAQTEERLYKIDSIRKSLFENKSSDSVFIANQHYKIGELYRKSLLIDSAYSYLIRAEKIFKKFNYKYETALTLYGIAVCQANDKDYTGSEVTSIEALTLLDELKVNNNINKYKSFIYNNLGIVFSELGQFDESIKYYNTALELKRRLKGDFERSIGLSENNIAVAYKRNRQLQLAIEKYNEIFSNKELIKNHPDVHVLALGNYAHSLYMAKEFDQLPGLYLKALSICDSIDDSYNSIIINQHLAEYYYDFNNIDSAKYHAYRAKDISEVYNNDDLLKSLLLLSKIEKKDAALNHLKKYVKLSDSLQKAERKTRDKFARIRFGTKEIEQENKQIAQERMWLLIISIVIIIASLLLYVVINQRNKNKELKFIQQQQKANEEIYNLMLSQNEGIEEARATEKKRISEELHDGVLGRLFGTRLSLDSLNMNNSIEAIKTRGEYIDELKNIEQDIRKVSHELNTDFVAGSGFIDIIKTLVEAQTKVYKIDYKLDYDDIINWEGISNKTKIHIYRIIQESLHNIYKHANATRVSIDFKLNNDKICLTLNDNGTGFNVNKAKSGIGLKNMNSRINEINGKINITSKIDVGTTVIIKVPIT